VNGTSSFIDNIQLGSSDNTFSIYRTPAVNSNARSTFIRGQSSDSTTGGDLILEAGSGASNGALLLGTDNTGVVEISSEKVTTNINGHTTARSCMIVGM